MKRLNPADEAHMGLVGVRQLLAKTAAYGILMVERSRRVLAGGCAAKPQLAASPRLSLPPSPLLSQPSLQLNLFVSFPLLLFPLSTLSPVLNCPH